MRGRVSFNVPQTINPGQIQSAVDSVDGVYFTTFVDLAERTLTLGDSDYIRLSSAAADRARAFHGVAVYAT
jgi:hypothetical protein